MPVDEKSSAAEELELFNLTMSDEDLIRNIRTRVERSKAYWNRSGSKSLEKIRKENVKLWLGEHLDESQLYRHNVRYVDNRIFTSQETIIAHVTSRIPSPETIPAQDNEISRQLTKDLGVALVQHAEKQQLMIKSKIAVRNVINKRIGFLKLRWDDGMKEIVVEAIDPEDIIVDKQARFLHEPPMLTHVLRATAEELISKFPDKERQIRRVLGIKRGTTSQMTREVEYWESWFTFYEDNVKKEGVAWVLEDEILGKMLHPHWFWRKRSGMIDNFLDYPFKPFIPFNYLNDGNDYIDPTSATEQAAPLQHVLNKRGRQIVENADMANSGWVFSGGAMTDDAAAELTGAPDEKIIVDAEDVRSAAQRYGAPQLPSYVLEDKFDARNEIDNIYGTPNIFRGEQTGNVTLGQDVLLQQQASSRQDELVRSIDAALDRYFKYVVQMMKKHYTEEHWFRVVGEDGQFDAVVMKNDKIENGVDVRVKPGTTLPVDKQRIMSVAQELARNGNIDPISLYEDLGLPNARKRYERLIKFQIDPVLLAEDIRKEEFDREAFMDVQVLEAGQAPKLRDEYSEAYLAFFRRYMMGGKFRALDEEIKQLFIDHATIVTEELRQTLLAQETQLPTDEESANLMTGLPELQAAQQALGGGMQGSAPQESSSPVDQAANQRLGQVS